MKKFTFLFLVTLPLLAEAQPDKGNFLLSGHITHSRSKYKYDNGAENITFNNSNVSISPRIGYFAVQNLCTGVSLTASFSKSRSDQDGMPDTKGNSTGIGPFMRYYIPVSEKLFVIAEAGYGWDFGRQEDPEFDPLTGDIIVQENKTESSHFHVGAGLAYFLTGNVSLELQSVYTKYNGMDFFFESSNLMTQLGLQVYFSRK